MKTVPIGEDERATLFACLDGLSHVGLAVSGGADSMALMHLANLWRLERGKAAPRLSVLSVDHGLRDGSAKEAEWVAERASDLCLESSILRWQLGEKKSRIQEDARAARYALMASYAHANGLEALVTAHHLDDQAETLLMRLGRGSGVDGLAAIPERGRWAGLSVLRPFLDVPKAQLVESLKILGVKWIKDPSNDDTRYERVRLRKAMDELEILGIGAEALARSAKRLRRARAALDGAADSFLQQNAVLDDAGFCTIGTKSLRDTPEEVVLRAMAKVLKGIGGQALPPRLAKLESFVEALIASKQAPLTLGGCQVVPGEDDLLILREAGREKPSDLVLNPGDCGLWDNRYRVSLDLSSSAPVLVRGLGKSGYGEVRARLGKALVLPNGVVEGLVSFWRDENVVAVPSLGFAARSSNSTDCNAEFVNSALFSGTH
jgi:tRNA(Ile)-lysidine synthase